MFVSFGFFLAAIVAFFARAWQLAFLLYFLHLGTGAIVLVRRR